MSRTYIKSSEINILKKIIYNLQSGNVLLTKTFESHKKELLQHTSLNYDVINIIRDYNEEIFPIFIKVMTRDISHDLNITVTLENYGVLTFYCAQITKVYLDSVVDGILKWHKYIGMDDINSKLMCIATTHIKHKNNCNYNFCKDVDTLDFFNAYMKHYYKKNNYFTNTSWYISNNVFINVHDESFCLLYPINHKKLKHIIVITKVLKKQFEKIMKEI